MTRGSILEYIREVQGRYIRAAKTDKGKILDEFIRVTGYHRKSAIRALNGQGDTKQTGKRGRPRKYQSIIASELKYLWEITDHLCSKRLHPFLPELLDVLKRNGKHATSNESDTQLRTISPSTMDRLLRINASCQFIHELPWSSYFDIETSFAMIRGGRMDVAVLGALLVSAKGDLAGWNTPARGLGRMGNIGGSMDLAVGAKKLIVAMEHFTTDGQPKILPECTYPLTAKGCVDLIVTNYALIEVTPKGLMLKEAIPGVSAEDVQKMTAAPLIIAGDFHEMEL